MIAHEHIQKFTIKELALILLLSVFSFLLIYFGTHLINPSYTLIFSLGITIVLMNLLMYVISKSGTALFYYTLVAFFTMNIHDIGITGYDKVIAFVIAVLVFEVVFLILKLHLHNVPADMILGSSLFGPALMFAAAFILSTIDLIMGIGFINMLLLSFGVTLGSSVIAFLLWYHIARAKPIVKFRNYISY